MFMVNILKKCIAGSPDSGSQRVKVLWDKIQSIEYYRLSSDALAALKLSCSCFSCDVDCISHNHSQSITDNYNNKYL